MAELPLLLPRLGRREAPPPTSCARPSLERSVHTALVLRDVGRWVASTRAVEHKDNDEQGDNGRNEVRLKGAKSMQNGIEKRERRGKGSERKDATNTNERGKMRRSDKKERDKQQKPQHGPCQEVMSCRGSRLEC